MNVLSLFDGMSCGQIALERAGVPVEAYYASEVDQCAMSITQKNYPNTIQLGPVEGYLSWGIDWAEIGLLIGGSPCQGFSNSGKKKSFNDPKSRLFFYYHEILQHIRRHNPCVKFLLENVQMKKADKAVITEYMGVEPRFINSRDYSALNRPRLYWSNIDYHLPPPYDITIKDIIGYGDTSKRLSKKAIKRLRSIKAKGLGYKAPILGLEDKFLNLDANFFKGPDGKRGVINDNGVLRMPTPDECELLQTVPLGYTEGVSNTQRYKMLGNGWTVEVISNIFKGLK